MFQVHIVSVFVRDQDRALDFYINSLGCELRVDRLDADGQRFVEVAPPGGGTRIALAPGGDDHAGGPTGITLNADDLGGAYATLTKRGVIFTQPPTPTAMGGSRSIFVDPDQNTFILQQHPPRRA